MIPSEENIIEVAKARIKAIRKKAHDLGDRESSDEHLLSIIVKDAVRLASKTHGSVPRTAQEAVTWAISDMHAVEVDQHAGTD